MGFVGPSPEHTGHTVYRYIVSYRTRHTRDRFPNLQEVDHRVVIWAYSAEDAIFQIREPLKAQEDKRSYEFKVESFPENPYTCTCPVKQPSFPKGSKGTVGSCAFEVDARGNVYWHCAEHGPNGHWESE